MYTLIFSGVGGARKKNRSPFIRPGKSRQRIAFFSRERDSQTRAWNCSRERERESLRIDERQNDKPRERVPLSSASAKQAFPARLFCKREIGRSAKDRLEISKGRKIRIGGREFEITKRNGEKFYRFTFRNCQQLRKRAFNRGVASSLRINTLTTPQIRETLPRVRRHSGK